VNRCFFPYTHSYPIPHHSLLGIKIKFSASAFAPNCFSLLLLGQENKEEQWTIRGSANGPGNGFYFIAHNIGDYNTSLDTLNLKPVTYRASFVQLIGLFRTSVQNSFMTMCNCLVAVLKADGLHIGRWYHIFRYFQTLEGRAMCEHKNKKS